jgi:hypothetical protein
MKWLLSQQRLHCIDRFVELLLPQVNNGESKQCAVGVSFGLNRGGQRQLGFFEIAESLIESPKLLERKTERLPILTDRSYDLALLFELLGALEMFGYLAGGVPLSGKALGQ